MFTVYVHQKPRTADVWYDIYEDKNLVLMRFIWSGHYRRLYLMFLVGCHNLACFWKYDLANTQQRPALTEKGDNFRIHSCGGFYIIFLNVLRFFELEIVVCFLSFI